MARSSDTLRTSSDIIMCVFGSLNGVEFTTSFVSTNKNVTSFNVLASEGMEDSPTKNGTGASKKFHRRLGRHGINVACHSSGINSAVNAQATAYDMAGLLETTATDFSMSKVDNMRIILSNDRSLKVSKIVHVGAATLSSSVFKSSIVKRPRSL